MAIATVLFVLAGTIVAAEPASMIDVRFRALHVETDNEGRISTSGWLTENGGVHSAAQRFDWDGSLSSPRRSFKGAFQSAASVPGSGRVMVAHAGGSCVIDLDDGTIRHVKSQVLVPRRFAISPDGSHYATLAPESIQFFTLSDYRLQAEGATGDGSVVDFRFTSTGTHMCVATCVSLRRLTGIVRVFDASTGRVVRQLGGEDPLPHCIRPLEADKVLVAYGNGEVALWNITDGTRVRTFTVGTGTTAEERDKLLVGQIAVSPDKTRIAVTTLGHNVKVFRVSDGALLGTLGGHPDGKVHGAAFNADGTKIVTAAGDTKLRIFTAPAAGN